MDERNLVRAAAEGDAEAFGRLVERYRDAVYGLAYHCLGSFEDARDVVQESFVKAYLKLSQLQQREKFGPWVRQIAMNECRSWQRRRAGHPNPSGAPEDRGVVPADADPERVAARVVVRKALRCLTEETRLAVTLFYIDGYSHQEIADFLDVSSGAVKTRLRDARRRLRKELIDMVEETLKGEELSEEFSQQVVRQAIDRAKEAKEGWAREEFVQSCNVALEELGKAGPESATELRSEVLNLLGEAESSWLGEPEQGMARYEEALGVARSASDLSAEAAALKGLYLAHLRHGELKRAHQRAGEAAELLAQPSDWQERALAQAAVDVTKLLEGRWQPGQPGGYALGAFALERAEEGWSWLKPEGVRNVSWGCPDFVTTFAHLWRLGPLLTSDPEVGQSVSCDLDAEWAYCGWPPNKDEPLRVVCEVESLTDRMVTPAGSFDRCLRLAFTAIPVEAEFATSHMQRTFAGTVRAWLAPGVGLVKLTQLDQNDTLRAVYLHEYHVPEGEGYWPTADRATWRYQWLRSWNRALFEELVTCRGGHEGVVQLSSACCTTPADDGRLRHYWQAAAVCEREGCDKQGYAEALAQVVLANWQHDRDEARARAEELLALQEDREDRWGAFWAERMLEDLKHDAEPASEELHERALGKLDLARELGHPLREAQSLSALGFICRDLGNYEQAEAYFTRAGDVHEALGDTHQCAVDRSHAEYVRQLAMYAGQEDRPSFCSGNCRVTCTDGHLSSEGSGSGQLDSPWPPREGGSPIRHFVGTGFGLALRALSRPPGERTHEWWNWGTPGGCESMQTSTTLEGSDEAIAVRDSAFDGCKLVEVTVSPSSETDTVEPERQTVRGYFAGTIRVWFAPGVGCVRLAYQHRNGLTTNVQLVEHHVVEPSSEYLPLAIGNRWVYCWDDDATRVHFRDTVFVAAHRGEKWSLGFVTAAKAPD